MKILKTGFLFNYFSLKRLGLVLGGISLLIFIASCGKLQQETVVFNNAFEADSIPAEIVDGKKEVFNGSGVLGRYAEKGFELQLKNLPPHDLLRISFDLNIHDTWEGNSGSPDGRDIWIMNINGWSSIYTTFANKLSCTNCTQAYPEAQPSYINQQFIFYNNPAQANAIRTDLPGACELKDVKGGTSMYRIVRVIEHKESTFRLGCFSQQEHPNQADKLCNESWSVDNMEIKAIKLR
ncbi:MAG TPA: hypothetical protein VGD22_11045 [Sphingobacteriaceae bacterium]